MHLVVLTGPQAVGKMVVGRRLAERLGYRLFTNHATIEPVIGVFDFGTPAFERVVTETRRRVIEEAVALPLPGLVLTLVLAYDEPKGLADLAVLTSVVTDAGGHVDVVELYADEAVRLTREGTAERLAAKATKRDVDWARRHLVESARTHRLWTTEDHPWPLDLPFHRLETDDLTADEAADRLADLLRRD